MTNVKRFFFFFGEQIILTSKRSFRNTLPDVSTTKVTTFVLNYPFLPELHRLYPVLSLEESDPWDCGLGGVV